MDLFRHNAVDVIVIFLRFSSSITVVGEEIEISVGALYDVAYPAVTAFAFTGSEPSFNSE